VNQKPEGMMDDDLCCSFEASQILDCSTDNTRRLARAGVLKAVMRTRAGRLFRRGDVKALAAARLAAVRRPRRQQAAASDES
jgi:hypothetical protein